MKTLTKAMQAAITPTIALDLLKEGNKRFGFNYLVFEDGNFSLVAGSLVFQ